MKLFHALTDEQLVAWDRDVAPILTIDDSMTLSFDRAHGVSKNPAADGFVIRYVRIVTFDQFYAIKYYFERQFWFIYSRKGHTRDTIIWGPLKDLWMDADDITHGARIYRGSNASNNPRLINDLCTCGDCRDRTKPSSKK